MQPTGITAHAVAYPRVWQAFRSLDRLADGRHDSPEWRAHSGPFAVCIIRVPASALEPELDECRLALERARLARIHPDHFLHVSLQELGFVTETPRQADEISPAALEEFVTNAAGPIGEQPRFHLTLGGVNSFQDAAFLEVHDGGHASLLHQRLLDIAATRRKSGFPYLPHMTVAHYTAAAPAAPMAEILSAWRDTRFGRTEVTEIEVATLSVSEPYPPFVPYAVFPLTG